jgi:hypothetical protein
MKIGDRISNLIIIWIKKVERDYQLKKKGDNRTPEEISKMNQLQQEIEAKFPNLEL